MSKYMMGGVAGTKEDQTRALTAYVLVAMLESFQMMRDNTPVCNSMGNIEIEKKNGEFEIRHFNILIQ